MTEFHLVPDEVHSSDAFALPRSPAGIPTGGLCHSTRVTSGPTTPSAFATSDRRVLQDLPGLLYLTAYPNPMLILARMMAQRNHQTPPDGVLRVVSPHPHIEAGESKPLRNAFFNRQGRHPSMDSFNAAHNLRRCPTGGLIKFSSRYNRSATIYNRKTGVRYRLIEVKYGDLGLVRV